MGLLRSLSMLLLLIWMENLHELNAQTTNVSSRSAAQALDAILQDYAYRAFVSPKTGVPYDGEVPSNLTGMKIAALRLRSGSLRRKGVAMYKEFHIPQGVIVSPYVERLVFVYQNLGNWSTMYYPLSGYTYLSPVLGLLAYDASNLSATNLQELTVKTSSNPFLVKFQDVKSAPRGTTVKCVRFDLQGLVNFSSFAADNVCSATQQGHFSIVVESVAPSPGQVSPAPSVVPEKKKESSNSRVWIVVGSVIGGLLLSVLFLVLVLWLQKCKEKKKMKQMEKAADGGEALQITSIGVTKAPAATGTRTQPMLEHEYAP